MKRRRHIPVALLALFFSLNAGCAMQAGAQVGTRLGDGGNRAVGGTHVGGMVDSIALSNRHGLVVGAQLEGGVVYDHGSEWNLRGRFGYRYAPAPQSWSAGWEAAAELGGPIRDSTLFPEGSWEVGLWLARVYWLGRSRGPEEQNRGYWFAVPLPQLVFFLSPLVQRSVIDDQRDTWWDLRVGMAFRWSLYSELL